MLENIQYGDSLAPDQPVHFHSVQADLIATLSPYMNGVSPDHSAHVHSLI